MQFESSQLGLVTYEAADVIHFEEGLFGFPEHHDFILVGEMTEEFPFRWLHSVTDPYLCFIVTIPFLFKEDYDFELSEAVAEKMQIQSLEEVQIYCMTVVPEEVKATRINLRGPVVVNLKTMMGKQLILNEDYPYQYLIFNRS